jgi:hypothetical protein
MHTKVFFSASLVSVALSGCSSMQGMDRGAPSVLAQPFTCNAGGVCQVTIVSPICSGGSCTASVNLDPLRLAAGNTNVPIKWDLPSGGTFGFCPILGDGVFLKTFDPGEEFDDGKAIGAPGGPFNKCKKTYQLRGRHTAARSEPYEYKVIFHDAAGNRYVIDPHIYND